MSERIIFQSGACNESKNTSKKVNTLLFLNMMLLAILDNSSGWGGDGGNYLNMT